MRDAVIVSAARTPIGRAKKGSLRDTVLGTTLLMEVLVVTAFTVVLSWAASLLVDGAAVVSPLGKLAVLVASLGTGAAAGWALRVYQERHGRLMEPEDVARMIMDELQ